eukprot:8294756-Karenia_brevis.AAC.1
MKLENLKTVSGIRRTNGFFDKTADRSQMFETLSRINHACIPNVKFESVDEAAEFAVIAVSDIQK